MDKWLVRRHPAAQPEVGDYEVADDIAFAVDNAGAGATTEIRRAVGGNGSIVKTGAGAVSIGLTDGTVGTKDVTVEAGALSVKYVPEKVPVYDEGAYFHFDASDLSSLDKSVVDNGDGTSTTNVLVWSDVRRNGKNAKSDFATPYGRAQNAVANPTLRGVVMPDGKVRSVVDFGSRTGSGVENPQSASMTTYNGTSAAACNGVR